MAKGSLVIANYGKSFYKIKAKMAAAGINAGSNSTDVEI
jgi:hypothetical protein